MRIKFLLFFIVSCLSIQLSAQKQNNFWYFGQRAGLNFNGGAPVAVTDGQLNTTEGCASICDASGNLLFYTNGQFVWDRNHDTMPNGRNLTGDPYSTQAAIIVPKPGSSTMYYIFTVDVQGGEFGRIDADGVSNGLTYSVVDMSANGGLGDVDISQKNRPIIKPVTEGITVARHANGVDFWVIAHGWKNNTYYAFNFSASGINLVPVQSNTGPIVTDMGGSTAGKGATGYMKSSLDGNKIAACHTIANKELVISNFNRSTGIVSGSITIGINSDPDSDGPYGVEFSSCNNYLYVTEFLKTVGAFYTWPKKSNIWRFDLTAGSIPASQTLFHTLNDEWFCALQLGSDGQIYMANEKRAFDSSTGEYFNVTSGFLHRINNPSLPGATFSFNAVNLAGKRVGFGLPTFVASFFNNTDFTYVSSVGADTIFCEGETALFNAQLSNYDSIRWYFGDPGSGINNTSTILNPTHTYAVAGNYTVTLYKYYCSATKDSVKKVIHVRPTPIFNIPDTSVCSGSPITLDPGISGASYNWSSGPTTQTATFSTGGSFSLLVTKNQCSYTDNFTISAAATPSATITPSGPTTFCSPGSVTLTATAGMSGYQWYRNGTLLPGQTTQTLNVSTSGSYTVVVTLSGCSNTSAATVVTVNTGFTITVTPAGSVNLCAGNTTNLTITTVGLSNIKWYKDAVLISGQTTTTLSVNASGSYYATGDNGGCSGTSNTVVVNVTATAPASVSISPSANPICSGTSVTFTATPVNGGASPVYQWFLNGSPVGSNSPTYTNAALANGNQVSVQMTSNSSCASGSPATSNVVTMTVSTPVTTLVSISPSANPVCSGTAVTFTATPVNGGASPVYQWLLNGSPVGSNSSTYTNATLSNADQVSVRMTSNAACVSGSPAISNVVTMTINAAVTASVSISPSANPVCSGTSVTFTATPVNGGASPVYQWLLNGSPVGSNSPTYTNAALANGDQVSVRMTSNATCVSGSPATSNVVTMTVNPSASISVSITASANPVCPGSPVTFTATPVNGGTSPVYQWLLNGNPVGTNSPTYSNSSLTNGDNISVEMTVSTPCATGSPATSNVINMSVSNIVVDLGPDQSLCAGSQVTLSTGISGADSYAWSTGESTPTIDVSSNGTYDVTVILGTCSASDQVNISFDQLPPSIISLGPDTTICLGDALLLNAGNEPGVGYQWQDGSTGNTFSASQAGIYHVSITNQCGVEKDSITISLEDCSCGVYLPNAFTPNADGRNDLFIAIATCPVTEYRFSVFNRWGEMVFDTDQTSVGWDGIYNGQSQPLDVYVYYLTYFNENLGEMITLKGYVNLLR